MQFIQGQGLEQVIAELRLLLAPGLEAGETGTGRAEGLEASTTVGASRVSVKSILRQRELGQLAESVLTGRLMSDWTERPATNPPTTNAAVATEGFGSNATAGLAPLAAKNQLCRGPGRSSPTARCWPQAISAEWFGSGIPRQAGRSASHFFNARSCSAWRYSPDGQMLAVGLSNDHTGKPGVRLWDTGTRQPVGDMLPSTHPVNRIEFRPDGRALLADGRSQPHGSGICATAGDRRADDWRGVLRISQGRSGRSSRSEVTARSSFATPRRRR